MATEASAKSSDFLKNLGKMYGTYTGGFIAFILLLAVIEQMGVPNKILGYLFVFFTLAVYAIIGVMTRTAEVSEYYVAGRRVPAFYNGMATGADWMSAASFVGMAGTLFLLGYDGIAWVLGWTGGFVLVSILIGPYLRKFGAYTVPDFLSFRYGGNFARALGVIVLVCLLLHLCDGADLRHRSHCLAIPRNEVRTRGVCGPCRHSALRDAGRHAGGDLDADRTIRRADHRLSDADRDPVHQEIRNSDSGAHLRAGDRGDHGAGAADAGDRPCDRGQPQAAHRSRSSTTAR